MSNFKIKNDDWGSNTFQETFIKEYYTSPNLNPQCHFQKPKIRNKKRKSNSTFSSQERQQNIDSNFSDRDNKSYETTKIQRANDKLSFSKDVRCKRMANVKQSNEIEVNHSSNSKKKRKNRLKAKLRMQRPLLNLKLDDTNKKKAFVKQSNLEMHKLQSAAEKTPTVLSNNSLLKHKLSVQGNSTAAKNPQNLFSQRSVLLKEKAMKVIQAAKFRLLNEKLYSVTGKSASQLFQEDADSFHAYHQGYQNQVNKWPVNPLDIIIKDLRQYPSESIVADLGCGDAKIARTFPKRKVFSFDLVALNDYVTCCDISKVPLAKNSVDIVIFCLSLMGTNLSDYILEAHRILKPKGLMKIAEVESRFEEVKDFVKNVEGHGFTLKSQDDSHKMFILFEFTKAKRNIKKEELPTINLNPCLYKKR